MGRQSKAIQARLKNLQKHVTTPQKAYVEDVTDEEDADYNHAKQHGTADLLEEGFFFLDEDSDSDEDSEYGEEDIDEEELAELKTEDDIHRFNAILAEAQAVAIQAAKEAAESKPKRKRHYTGNSTRSARRHAMKRRHLEATGQKFINAWFSKKKDSPEVITEISDNEEEGIESDNDLEEPEIEERINRLFLSPSPVSLLL